MTNLSVVGGVYAERAIWPDWDQVYGSAGRAAAAISGHVDNVSVHAYATREIIRRFEPVARAYGFNFTPTLTTQTIRFEYTHGLATPTISPSRITITRNPPITVAAENVLRFGMLEGDAIIEAKCCVYDPQDQISPAPFGDNNSRTEKLAIVANQAEIFLLGKSDNLDDAAGRLLSECEVVVAKAGPKGAFVYTASGTQRVPAYSTQFIWPVGSGDVFAAMFAARWAANGDPAIDAADLASRAVAEYVESMALPAPSAEALRGAERKLVQTVPGTVYLASPFFSMGERWMVEEARRSLYDLGMQVFSPLHDVGPGSAEQVAPLDLQAIDSCDVVFAILDGLDSGTLFEVGYARRAGKPVYVLAQTVSEENLKMIEGSGCQVYSDFVSALHHLVWRA